MVARAAEPFGGPSPAAARASLTELPPALRSRVRAALAALPASGPLDPIAADRLAAVLADGEGWLGADAALADAGFWMIDPRRDPELRRRGCAWLALFPSADTSVRLGRLVADASAPPRVRDAAITALGDRELRGKHSSTRWTAEAAALADDALWRLADAMTTDGELASDALPLALRHVQTEAASAIIARAPGLWADAIECYATPALARVLYVSLDDIAADARMRALRLVAETLGDDALELVRARAEKAGEAERVEARLIAVALGGEPELPLLEAALAGASHPEPSRARARWHLEHPGVMPTVRGLRVARGTAALVPAERAARCARAADDLAALAPFERHREPYIYELWAWMVRGSGDPARARILVDGHAAAQRDVRDLYLEDLAARGRVSELIAAAHELGGVEAGALALAIHGRPLAALELAAAARLHTPELACARALGCYRAARPELAARVIADDPPPAEVVDPADAAPTADGDAHAFPGPHERWLVAHAPALCPALAALAGGLPALAALALPAPVGAEPDRASLAPIAALEGRLARGLAGSTIYLVGEFDARRREAIRAALVSAGARIVGGPTPDIDFYVRGDACPARAIAQLERHGARSLDVGIA